MLVAEFSFIFICTDQSGVFHRVIFFSTILRYYGTLPMKTASFDCIHSRTKAKQTQSEGGTNAEQIETNEINETAAYCGTYHSYKKPPQSLWRPALIFIR